MSKRGPRLRWRLVLSFLQDSCLHMVQVVDPILANTEPEHYTRFWTYAFIFLCRALLIGREQRVPDASTADGAYDSWRDGPVLVATRNSDLRDVLASVPSNRRRDLVFLQVGPRTCAILKLVRDIVIL